MTEEERKNLILTTPEAKQFKKTREWAEQCAEEALKKAEEVTGIIPLPEEKELLVSWYMGEISRLEYEAGLSRIACSRRAEMSKRIKHPPVYEGEEESGDR